MAVCPNCGEENLERARLCMMCGAALGSVPGEPVEERKIVSVLFVDLVGFTARSHDADPEDVRASLAPYHQMVRAESERYGGTVEKFIGDGVICVFGAPAAHEDDPERAVRAGLRIVEAIGELKKSGADLSVRVAVNTGEGLVTLSARLHAGEAMVAGDVVNTAARLQTVASVNEVVVGEVTYRSTKNSIQYEELEPVVLKGKPDPVPVWRALSARARVGVDVAAGYATPFVGRDLDLATLKTLFQRTLQESSLQLITIVGEPGVGKSRLVAEFSSYIDDLPEPVEWRQGRSLPYGEGITFWALGEIVKAQAGIKESDSPEVAADKLATAVAIISDESDRAWLQSRLAPLVGAQNEGRADQEESFTAWLRFLEAIAATRPLVLVFEDLHWADATLLSFIEYVVQWSTGVPILVVCTTRPELFDTQPSWAAKSRNATTISLSPLDDGDISRLISGLLAHTVLPAEIHAALLERAGGNPLFAEEFVRMLIDRRMLQQRGRNVALDPRANIPMPDSVQATIAARLDNLPSERKSLLHDAAVVGRVFWSGAVAAMSDMDDGTVRHSLRELVHADFLRPARTSSIEGQYEYSFWHALIRDVAYGQLPRPQRASKHLAAARWLEAIAGERVADHAEILTHHHEEATKLLTFSGMTQQAAELVETTIRLLVLAGDRAMGLDWEAAQRHYEKALRLIPPQDPRRPGTHLKLGDAVGLSGRPEEAIRHFELAINGSRADHDRRGEARALIYLAGAYWMEGRNAGDRRTMFERAIGLLEKLEPSPELADAYRSVALDSVMAGAAADAVAWADKALVVAKEVGALREQLSARLVKVCAHCELGVAESVESLREVYGECLNEGFEDDALFVCSWLCEWLWLSEGPSRALNTYEEAIAGAERRGNHFMAMNGRAESLWFLYDLGEWEILLEHGRRILRWTDQPSHHALKVMGYVALVLVFRQRVAEAHDICARLLAKAREAEDYEVLVPALAVGALVAEERGEKKVAVERAMQLRTVTRHSSRWRSRHLPTALRILVAAGEVDKAVSLADGIEVTAARDRYSVLTGRAILAEATERTDEARGLYEEAAQHWTDFGCVLEEGQTQLGLARCLITLGNGQAATEPLHKARGIFSRLGAVSLIHEVDRHLSETAASGS